MLALVRLEDEAGVPIAFIINYAVHASHRRGFIRRPNRRPLQLFADVQNRDWGKHRGVHSARKMEQSAFCLKVEKGRSITDIGYQAHFVFAVPCPGLWGQYSLCEISIITLYQHYARFVPGLAPFL